MKLMNGLPYTVSIDPYAQRVTRVNPAVLMNDGCLGVGTKAFVVNSKLNVIASVCGGGHIYQTRLPVPWCPDSHRTFTFAYQQMVVSYLAVLSCIEEFLPLELLCVIFAYVADDCATAAVEDVVPEAHAGQRHALTGLVAASHEDTRVEQGTNASPSTSCERVNHVAQRVNQRPNKKSRKRARCLRFLRS